MFESKYSKVLTIILAIVIIAILALLGFLGYDIYQKYFIESEAAAFVENFEKEKEDENKDNKEEQNQVADENANNPLDQLGKTPGTGENSGNTKPTYKGFNMVGTMVIPKTNFKYPVLEKVTKQSIETAVAVLYGAGINQVGNTVIIGHNYRNGLFFSNNKKLNIGDQIYITDNSGNKLTYTIYNKFETTDTDTSFYQRDTQGKPEVTLSTCTDDSKARLIILAKAE